MRNTRIFPFLSMLNLVKLKYNLSLEFASLIYKLQLNRKTANAAHYKPVEAKQKTWKQFFWGLNSSSVHSVQLAYLAIYIIHTHTAGLATLQQKTKKALRRPRRPSSGLHWGH